MLGSETPAPGVPARLRPAGTLRLPAGHQVAFAVTDQIGPTHALERVAQQRPVLGIVIAQKRLVQTAHL
jgi:hypothetical protein